MLEVKFYSEAEDRLLKFAVIYGVAGETRIGFFDSLPEALTYPEIQPKLAERVWKEKEAHAL